MGRDIIPCLEEFRPEIKVFLAESEKNCAEQLAVCPELGRIREGKR